MCYFPSSCSLAISSYQQDQFQDLSVLLRHPNTILSHPFDQLLYHDHLRDLQTQFVHRYVGQISQYNMMYRLTKRFHQGQSLLDEAKDLLNIYLLVHDKYTQQTSQTLMRLSPIRVPPLVV